MLIILFTDFKNFILKLKIDGAFYYFLYKYFAKRSFKL